MLAKSNCNCLLSCPAKRRLFIFPATRKLFGGWWGGGKGNMMSTSPPPARQLRSKLWVSPGLARVSPIRLQGKFWERLFSSGEPSLAENSPVQSIAITYPPRVINFAWTEWNWIVLFFVISLIAGFIFKSVLGIQV